MQNENEELERFEESHPLSVHRHGIMFILVQKSFTDGDQPFEPRQPGLIREYCIDLHIVETDSSHTRPQERTQEQTKIFRRFCLAAGIKINKPNFFLIHE